VAPFVGAASAMAFCNASGEFEETEEEEELKNLRAAEDSEVRDRQGEGLVGVTQLQEGILQQKQLAVTGAEGRQQERKRTTLPANDLVG
jgi:hypothetical protein